MRAPDQGAREGWDRVLADRGFYLHGHRLLRSTSFG